MTAPSFHLAALADCPVGARVALALALAPRGTGLERSVLRSGTARLTLHGTGRPPAMIEDPLAMIELIEDLHPDQPLHPRDPARRAQHRAAMVRTLRAEARLARVLAARDPRDLDLEVHHLRHDLRQLQDGLEPAPTARQPLSNRDVVLAPLLWALALLDGAFQSHLLTGLERISFYGDWLSQQEEIGAELAPARAGRLLEAVSRSEAAIAGHATRPDWAAAVGPLGKENQLLPHSQTRKIPSIGRGAALR